MGSTRRLFTGEYNSTKIGAVFGRFDRGNRPSIGALEMVAIHLGSAACPDL